MKIDTTAIQFQMYKDIGWIPAKYFKDRMSDQKWLFPDEMWIGVEHWVLKNGASENAHYEREENSRKIRKCPIMSANVPKCPIKDSPILQKNMI